jgi:hypothetical protein
MFCIAQKLDLVGSIVCSFHKLKYLCCRFSAVDSYVLTAKYEGDSNEKLKSAIKIKKQLVCLVS